MDVKDVVVRFKEGLDRLNKFDEHPIGKEIIKADAEARLSERKALADKVGALKAGHDKAMPGLLKARDAAASALTEARSAFDRARAAFSGAEQALDAANQSTEAQVAALERQLRATASDAIAAFAAELDSWADRVRKQQPVELDVPLGFSGAPVTIASNWRSINRWLERYRATRQAVEALLLEALSEAQLATRLQELREELGPEPTAADVEPSRPEYEARVRGIVKGWAGTPAA